MKICEIFTSIQGESSYAGLPCTFIRLTGCNLRCSYCDTKYAYTNGKNLSEEEIINEIKHAGISLVEITGGEPLLQKEVFHLIKKLLDDDYKILIETNGSLSIRDIDKRAIIILDIKTPGSGMNEKMDFSNLERIKPKDEIKFVITNEADYKWARDLINKYKLTDKCHLLLSPAYGVLLPENLAKWMIKDKIKARLNLQIHKYIFGAGKRAT
ncbi:MAG: radical SAM protein [Nitrospirota bacterium]